MPDIIVIGNGFDLATGLKSSVGNFVDYCKKAKIKDNVLIMLYRVFFQGSHPINSVWFRFVDSSELNENWGNAEYILNRFYIRMIFLKN